MGASHALAYRDLPGFEIVGFVVAKRIDRARELASRLNLSIPVFTDYYESLDVTRPDVVSINTYADTHADYSIEAMSRGCHIFMEKPMAQTVQDAERVVEAARKTNRKVVIGYILRHHPAWIQFIDSVRQIGKPLVMRMNLNQQSFGPEWNVHKEFIRRMPPLVDCGVHYIDVMCQMTRAKPTRVHGIAARLTEEIPAGTHNYGALQIVFDDDSVGWYEVGWGPMISRSAFFVKDVYGPKGSVSIEKETWNIDPSDLSKHTEVNTIVIHSSETDVQGNRVKEDRFIKVEDEPSHDELCRREQEYLYRVITEDIDLTEHLEDAVNSMKVCYAAVESYETGQVIHL